MRPDAARPAGRAAAGAAPSLLAGFLALLAVGAVGHALTSAVRRRRHDLAVLRAVGLTHGQSRTTVLVQALVLAGVGLTVGVPVGFVLGRFLWRSVADSTRSTTSRRWPSGYWCSSDRSPSWWRPCWPRGRPPSRLDPCGPRAAARVSVGGMVLRAGGPSEPRPGPARPPRSRRTRRRPRERRPSAATPRRSPASRRPWTPPAPPSARSMAVGPRRTRRRRNGPEAGAARAPLGRRPSRRRQASTNPASVSSARSRFPTCGSPDLRMASSTANPRRRSGSSGWTR